jgi:hypothetical protein
MILIFFVEMGYSHFTLLLLRFTPSLDIRAIFKINFLQSNLKKCLVQEGNFNRIL